MTNASRTGGHRGLRYPGVPKQLSTVQGTLYAFSILLCAAHHRGRYQLVLHSANPKPTGCFCLMRVSDKSRKFSFLPPRSCRPLCRRSPSPTAPQFLTFNTRRRSSSPAFCTTNLAHPNLAAIASSGACYIVPLRSCVPTATSLARRQPSTPSVSTS